MSRSLALLLLAGCTATIAPTHAEPATGWTKEALTSAPKGEWFAIDHSDIKGKMVAFDIQEAYPWLNAWAKAWAEDARMWRMSVDHFPGDGRPLNLIHDKDAEIDIRFISPTMVEASKKLAETTEVKLPTAFRISSDGEGGLMAMVSDPIGIVPKEAPPAALGCGLDEVLKVAKASGKMEKKPYYDPWMRVWRGNWAWSIGDVYVNAETCTVM